jgi:hypothetical protein
MLLTLDEAQGLADSSLGDESLQLLLDAAEVEITRAVGPVGNRTEIVQCGSRLLALRGQAASIVSITERLYTTDTVLATDDYVLWPEGTVIERLLGGTNSRGHFRGRVEVEYVPVDDIDLRKVVQADLIKLMVQYAPGVTAETVGSWTRQLASNSVWNASEEREAILARLFLAGRMTVSG